LEVCGVVQFVTLVQTRPGATAGEPGSHGAAHAAQWQHLKHQIELVGARVSQIWNVLGNDYDLLFIGDADDPKTLHRIDAVCKGDGFASKTQPAIEAEEYARLVDETAEVLSYGRQRRGRGTERDEA
jgi:uncharacterized protein with GYD domain